MIILMIFDEIGETCYKKGCGGVNLSVSKMSGLYLNSKQNMGVDFKKKLTTNFYLEILRDIFLISVISPSLPSLSNVHFYF